MPYSNSSNHNIATTSSNDQQPKTAKEVIAANVQSLIEQLESGQSDALTAYLNAMSRFHNYTLGNILEIARQKPDATRVAGFWKWKELGRSVKKAWREAPTCPRSTTATITPESSSGRALFVRGSMPFTRNFTANMNTSPRFGIRT